MADPWRPTLRKRLILFALDIAGRVAPPANAGHDARQSTEIRGVLVIELWNIGDLVLTLPFLAELRAKFPAAKITLLGRAYAREVLGGSGLVDEFIAADLGWKEGGGGRGSPRYDWRELLRVRRELRSRSFDLAFKSRGHVREHLLLSFVRARRKIAYSLGAGDSVLTDAITADLSATHKAADWLALLAPFGGGSSAAVPPLRVALGDEKWAERFLRDAGVSSSARVVGVHPGASVAAKRWPLQQFAAVAKRISSMPATKVVGFTDEYGYGAELGKEKGVVLASRLSLPRLMALIARCDLLVCNDSGPMHLAAAMGVPVVAIFATGIDRWFAPLGEGGLLLTPDDGGGLDSISEEKVFAAVEAGLGS